MARHFPNWIAKYLEYTDNTEAPEAFHLWTAVSTIAGALRRNVYIDMNSFEWVPNFMILFVAKAGIATKSTSLRHGERLLRTLQPKIKIGSTSGSWQAIAQEIAAAQQQCWGGFKVSPMSYFISELGTFLDPSNQEMVDFLVDSWDAQKTSFKRTTMAKGSYEIQCPCVNIIAATTPAWLKEKLTNTMLGGGFMSRLVIVHAEKKRKLIAYPGREKHSEEHLALEAKLAEDLKHISGIEGEMKLTKEAFAWGERWYHDHFALKRQLTGERFDGWYARKQTHLHKLAMILAISEGDRLWVDKHHLEQANAMLFSIEQGLAEVVENVSGKQFQIMHKREILSTVAGEGEVDREQLYRKVHMMMSGPDFDKAMADLVKAQQLNLNVRKNVTWVSVKERPKVVQLREVK